MKRILVPTDFSPNAEFALRVAVDIALKANGIIILYHVHGPLESPFIDNAIKRKKYNINTEIILHKRLQRLKKRVLKDNNQVLISTVIGHFPLINTILGFAERNHIDLIVMGTKGASGIKRILIGSVASKITQRTDIPVLLIPERVEQRELNHIVFATDFHPSDQQALSLTLAFAEIYGSTVTVVHLITPDASEKRSREQKDDFDSYVNFMQQKFNNGDLRFKLLETAAEQEKIETLYKGMPYDLLVMVREKKSFFQKVWSGSYTQSMSYIAERPLLIMPPQISPETEIT